MGILNKASDGLPSVLFALIRAIRQFGALKKDELLALCCPPSLETVSSGFKRDRQGPQTLTRWTQLGLFQQVGDTVVLHSAIDSVPHDRVGEVRGIGRLLRQLAFEPDNNQELNDKEGALAADLSLALCWALAQDVFVLPGGAYSSIGDLEMGQFGSNPPYPFQNDTRWNGFKTWVPLLGFGWTERAKGNSVLVVDATSAIRDTLPAVFGDLVEMPIVTFMRQLAEHLPVLDGGQYRTAVEARLATSAWRAPREHEVSISLSTALVRLESTSLLGLEARADAPKRTLLGRGYRELRQVSHVMLRGAHA